jgi:tetratricopeptide (TPR) repeat protein
LKTSIFRSILLCFLVLLSACSSLYKTKQHSENPDSRLDHLLLLYQGNINDQQSCQEMWEENHPTLDCGRILNALEQLVSQFPRHPRILMTVALFNYESGKIARAQAKLDRLLSLQIVNPHAVILRSRIAMEQGNMILAHRLLSHQSHLVPDNAVLHELLAAVYYLDGKYFEADKELITAQRLGAPAWRLAYHQGLVAESQSRWSQARTYYQQCLSKKPYYQAARARLTGLGNK